MGYDVPPQPLYSTVIQAQQNAANAQKALQDAEAQRRADAAKLLGDLAVRNASTSQRY